MLRKFDGGAGYAKSSTALARAVARALEAVIKRKLAAEARLRRRVEAAARSGSLFRCAAILGLA